MSAVIDRWGFFGANRIPLSWPRVRGLWLFAGGAALPLRK
jgi:uncharacterized membrane protein YdcZ (DUF606 family)